MLEKPGSTYMSIALSPPLGVCSMTYGTKLAAYVLIVGFGAVVAIRRLFKSLNMIIVLLK
jgi:hypothetical protein